MATNVRPQDLNYNHYGTKKYDNDIVRSVPGYVEINKKIEEFIKNNFSNKILKILELGVGTGLTAERVLSLIPNSNYTGIDFSERMLSGARRRLSRFRTNLIKGDFSEIDLTENNDLILAVISIHHQKTNKDKKKIFSKIFSSLKKKGVFILGDLMTFKDPKIAALNEAQHFKHLVDNSRDAQSLKEWAHHHKFLNNLAPVEDQISWLKEAGFKDVKIEFSKFNTVLLFARR